MSPGRYLDAGWQRSLIDMLMSTGNHDFIAAAFGGDDEV